MCRKNDSSFCFAMGILAGVVGGIVAGVLILGTIIGSGFIGKAFGRKSAAADLTHKDATIVELNADLQDLIGDLKGLILEELNVKNVIFVNDLDKYMDFYVKPNFKVAGPIFGANIKVFSELLEGLTDEEVACLNNGKTIHITIDDTDYEIDSSYTDIRISAKEGYNVGMENNLFVILNTVRTEELISEGIAREFVSKVQNIRKTEDYNVIDRITITYNGDEDIKKAVDNFKDYIMSETLATEITFDEKLEKTFDLNGHEAGIVTKRV